MLPSLEGRVIGVVGWKDSGKTRVIEGLVRFFKDKGFTVGTVKHIKENLKIQDEMTDSGRHLGAGAQACVVVGDDATVIFKAEPLTWDQAICRYLGLCDLVIVEGFKHESLPKIMVKDEREEPQAVEGIVAVVGDVKDERYPSFGFDEVAALGDFLLEKQIVRIEPGSIHLVVNGKPVSMNDFVRKAFSGVITGFVTTLKRIEKPTTIELILRLPEE